MKKTFAIFLTVVMLAACFFCIPGYAAKKSGPTPGEEISGDKTADTIRQMFKKGDDVRDAGLKTPADIKRYDDIQYVSDKKYNVLDVYRPKKAGNKKLPVIVSYHGGGWVYGDKERYQYYCMNLAQRGFAVVNYTYRLAPAYKFPAPLEDTNSVFSWILKNAKKYGFDTKNLFALGDSAGGQGLACYAAILTNPEYAAKYSFKVPKGLKLNAIALNCGVYDFSDPSVANMDMMKGIFKVYLPDWGTQDELKMLSAVNWVTSDYPPTYIMTATGDFLKMQAPIMAKCLSEHNVPFTYKLYGSQKNQLGHVFHCNIKSPDAKICNDDECSFFRAHMA